MHCGVVFAICYYLQRLLWVPFHSDLNQWFFRVISSPSPTVNSAANAVRPEKSFSFPAWTKYCRGKTWSLSSSRFTPKPVMVDGPIRCKPCYAFTACNIGTISVMAPWKMPCTKSPPCVCSAYSHAWRSLNNIHADHVITSMSITQ